MSEVRHATPTDIDAGRASPSAVPPAIEMRGVAKRFGAVQANRGAELLVPPGQIHALVGENGAGKSTLMRILSGMYEPDAGRVSVEGREVTGWRTADAIAAGVGMVHQHFMLVPTLTVAENVVLGMEPRSGIRFDRAAAEREVEALGQRTGLVVDPRRYLSELSVGEAQRVEILKTLYRGARILILDEPTAVLSPPEVEELWRVLRRLRDEGGTVVLITHKLDEVIAISDAITVMRAGATVERIRTEDTTPRAIARAMVGRDVALALDAAAEGSDARGAPPNSNMPPSSAPAATDSTHAGTPARTRPALELRSVSVTAPTGRRLVDAVSLSIAAGEILGIAGVEGNGQTALVEAIAGLTPSTGAIALDGREIQALSVRARADAGLSHIPEDRHRRGLILEFPVRDNLILGLQHHFTRGPALDRARIAEHAQAQVAAFDIRPPDPALPARALSGGNQQKVVIAREMGRDFRVLLAAQPTRGVDVGAIEFIHQQLRDARASGRAVLLVSADLAEILALSDRIAVMYRGRLAITLPRSQATPEVLGPYMTGASEEGNGMDPSRPGSQ